MKVLIQRVSEASIRIDSELYSEIAKGLLVFIGVEKTDTSICIDKLIKKVSELRIFPDDKGKMNLSLLDIKAELLLVSQFTLAGNCNRGKRPSFDSAAPPDLARELYNDVIEGFRARGISVETGCFAADMKISLINDGPVSFHLEF